MTNLVLPSRVWPGEAPRGGVSVEGGRWGANAMNEHAQQELKTVQGKDGVADSLFDNRIATVRADD